MGKGTLKKRAKANTLSKPLRARKAMVKRDLAGDVLMGGSMDYGGVDLVASKIMSKSQKRKQRLAKKKVHKGVGKGAGNNGPSRAMAIDSNSSSSNNANDAANDDDDWLVPTQALGLVGGKKKAKKKLAKKKPSNKKLSKASNLRWLEMLAKVVTVLSKEGASALIPTHPLHSWLVSQRKLWDDGRLDKVREEDLNKLAVYDGFSWFHSTLVPRSFFQAILDRRNWPIKDIQDCTWVKTHVDLAHKGLLPEWGLRHIAALSKDPALCAGEDLDLSALSFAVSADDLDLNALTF